MNAKRELIRRLEIRLKQLTGELDLGYKLHKGHHTRDVITVLEFLKSGEYSEKLIANLPDIPYINTRGKDLEMKTSNEQKLVSKYREKIRALLTELLDAVNINIDAENQKISKITILFGSWIIDINEDNTMFVH